MQTSKESNILPVATPANREIRSATAVSSRLTDVMVRALPAPAAGNRVKYDRGKDAVKGFGVRVTAGGAKSFVLNYHTAAGRERRLTIGGYPAWSVDGARGAAKKLRREIDMGADPLGERKAERAAPTVSELADRYLAEHAEPKKRTAVGDRQMLDRWVRPRWATRKVKDVGFSDIDRLHREISRTAPYQANRVAALLSKMFSLGAFNHGLFRPQSNPGNAKRSRNSAQ
jgi:hypothetical protein